jgi:hypothetical protein
VPLLVVTSSCRDALLFCRRSTSIDSRLFLVYHLQLISLQLARLLDGDGLGGLSGLGADLLDGLDDVETLDDLAEDDVLTVEPRGLDGADEELGAVGAGASVGHGEDTGASVLEVEVLVLELLAVDGLSAGAVAAGEVTTLKHELGDDAVEAGALEVERLARLAGTLLASAEGAEVLSGLGDLVLEELHDDAAGWRPTYGDVEEDIWISGHDEGC